MIYIIYVILVVAQSKATKDEDVTEEEIEDATLNAKAGAFLRAATQVRRKETHRGRHVSLAKVEHRF